MHTHETYSDLLPVYAAGHLDGEQRRQLECHLQECAACRADLALWQTVGAEIVATGQEVIAPPIETLKVLPDGKDSYTRKEAKQGHFLRQQLKPFDATPKRAWQLLLAQIPLVKHEIWPAAALVMALGCVIAILFEKEDALRIVAPLVAAASLAVIYGPEHDPAAELAFSTPTSPWKILLARITLVFSYNLTLAMTTTLLLPAFIPVEALSGLILSWLAPMTFLSALALVLSLWIGTANALIAAYLCWLAQFLIFTIQPFASIAHWSEQVIILYARLWQSPTLLFSLAGLLLIGALWSAGHIEQSFHFQEG